MNVYNIYVPYSTFIENFMGLFLNKDLILTYYCFILNGIVVFICINFTDKISWKNNTVYSVINDVFDTVFSYESCLIAQCYFISS